MKKITVIAAVVGVLMACGNGSNSTDSDSTSNVNSTTPPPIQDTNPIGIMMGNTSIGINDSLRK